MHSRAHGRHKNIKTYQSVLFRIPPRIVHSTLPSSGEARRRSRQPTTYRWRLHREKMDVIRPSSATSLPRWSSTSNCKVNSLKLVVSSKLKSSQRRWRMRRLKMRRMRDPCTRLQLSPNNRSVDNLRPDPYKWKLFLFSCPMSKLRPTIFFQCNSELKRLEAKNLPMPEHNTQWWPNNQTYFTEMSACGAVGTFVVGCFS